jgi:hypothetical protein
MRFAARRYGFRKLGRFGVVDWSVFLGNTSTMTEPFHEFVMQRLPNFHVHQTSLPRASQKNEKPLVEREVE